MDDSVDKELAERSHSKSLENSSISKWRSVTSDVPVAGPEQFNVFVSSIGSKIRCTLGKSADDTKLRGAIDILEQRYFQRNLNRLEG